LEALTNYISKFYELDSLYPLEREKHRKMVDLPKVLQLASSRARNKESSSVVFPLEYSEATY
jgi:hypothetical protein